MTTNVLIALNILVMLALAVKSPAAALLPDRQILIDFGANLGFLTCSGQQWRLITSLFLHVGVLHLLINMYALRQVGPVAEDLFGWRTFLVIYLFSGVIGSLASCLWNPMLVSAGASGAIFGVYGSLLAFMYVQRDKYPRKTLRYHAIMAFCLLSCSFVYGCLVPDIDNFAHLGGVIAGAFSGFLFAQLQVRERYRNAYTMPVLALVVGAMWVVTQISFDRGGYSLYYQGLQAMKVKNFAGAVEMFKQFIALHPDCVEAYGCRGIAFSKSGDLKQAANDFTRIIMLSPKSVDGYNSRAWVEAGLKQFDAALSDASAAVKLNPKWSPTYDARGYTFFCMGRNQDALADFQAAIKLSPKDPAAHYHKLKVLNALGQAQQATIEDSDCAKLYQPESWER